jgi:Universal stress protein family
MNGPSRDSGKDDSLRPDRVHVIIATDGSEASTAAAHQASRLLPADADLSLVTIIEQVQDPMADAGGFEGTVITEDEAQSDYRASMVAAEGALAASARAFGPRSSNGSSNAPTNRSVRGSAHSHPRKTPR